MRLLREYIREAVKKKRRWPPPHWNWPPRRPHQIQAVVLDWFDKNGRGWTTMQAYRKMRDAKLLDGSPWEQKVAIEFIEEELGYWDPSEG